MLQTGEVEVERRNADRNVESFGPIAGVSARPLPRSIPPTHPHSLTQRSIRFDKSFEQIEIMRRSCVVFFSMPSMSISFIPLSILPLLLFSSSCLLIHGRPDLLEVGCRRAGMGNTSSPPAPPLREKSVLHISSTS